ncbi:MAG: hypothetical protein JRI52_01820 [Deltaproteobacteria bacterium]|nr:hypothetical protein [Deltaproteobacteria bacterium]
MEQGNSPTLPKKTVTYLLLCVGGVLGFLVFAVYPNQKSLAGLDMEIKTIEGQIKEQKILFPVYENLLKKGKFKKPGAFPFPQKAKLGRHETERISLIFGERARKSNLSLVDVIPDVESLSKGSGVLTVNMLMKGNFLDFRDFLIHLGEIPYVENIEEIKIQPAEGIKEFSLKVSLSLKK